MAGCLNGRLKPAAEAKQHDPCLSLYFVSSWDIRGLPDIRIHLDRRWALCLDSMNPKAGRELDVSNLNGKIDAIKELIKERTAGRPDADPDVGCTNIPSHNTLCQHYRPSTNGTTVQKIDSVICHHDAAMTPVMCFRPPLPKGDGTWAHVMYIRVHWAIAAS